eukprot:PhF_6_TR18928/c0_g1_i4/m.27701
MISDTIQPYNEAEHRRISHVLHTIPYSLEGNTYSIDKKRPLWSLLQQGKLIYSNRLQTKIQCIEGVFLALYLTQKFHVHRFAMSFESKFQDEKTKEMRSYHHLVLGIASKGQYGALGISRSADLMNKEMRFTSLLELIDDFIASYSKNGHAAVKVKLSEPIAQGRTLQQVIWAHTVIQLDIDTDEWRPLVTKYDQESVVAPSSTVTSMMNVSTSENSENGSCDASGGVEETPIPSTEVSRQSRAASMETTTTSSRSTSTRRNSTGAPRGASMSRAGPRRPITIQSLAEALDLLLTNEKMKRARIDIQQGVDRVALQESFQQTRVAMVEKYVAPPPPVVVPVPPPPPPPPSSSTVVVPSYPLRTIQSVVPSWRQYQDILCRMNCSWSKTDGTQLGSEHIKVHIPEPHINYTTNHNPIELCKSIWPNVTRQPLPFAPPPSRPNSSVCLIDLHFRNTIEILYVAIVTSSTSADIMGVPYNVESLSTNHVFCGTSLMPSTMFTDTKKSRTLL